MLSFCRLFLSITVSGLFSLTCYATDLDKLPPLTYEGAEHIFLGEEVKLFFSKTDPGQSGKYLNLPSGLALNYGEIIAFGDLYEVVDKPIALAETSVERRARFMQGFNSFALETSVVPEAKKLLKVLHKEQQKILEDIKNGEEPETAFKKTSNDTNRQLNCITGGGCSSTWYLNPGRYLKLASSNFDHFGDNAWISYQVGHEIAMEQAIKAHDNYDLKQLEIAYAMNAFASHFLADRFAAGHLRTPRLELDKYVTPSVTGALLSGYMHAEENSYGLHVHNAIGNRWIAHGDRAYLSDKNRINRQFLQAALQLSIREVFMAFLTGKVQENQIKSLLPYPDEVGNKNDLDISPLFYWNKAKFKLIRRENTNDVYDRNWTEDWWGWSTLALLSQERGIPAYAQAALALSNESNYAVKEGLIKEKKINEFLTRKI